MNTIFIAGHARLPSGMAAQNMYETLTITAEIDKNYGVIVTSSCTLATIHGQGFVEQMLKGYSLQDGIEKTIQIVKMHYLDKSGYALVSSLNTLYIQNSYYYYIRYNYLFR